MKIDRRKGRRMEYELKYNRMQLQNVLIDDQRIKVTLSIISRNKFWNMFTQRVNYENSY